LRVARKDAQQLDPGVTGPAHDADFDHHYLREPVYQPGPSNALESPARQKLETANKKAAPGAAFLCESLNISVSSILAFPRLMQADFLSLDLARIAVTRKPALLRSGFERGSYSIRARVRPWRTAPPVRTSPPPETFTMDVELAQLVGQYKRLTHNHLPGFTREVFVRRAIVHDKIAFAGLK